jgi:hypothetical protein
LRRLVGHLILHRRDVIGGQVRIEFSQDAAHGCDQSRIEDRALIVVSASDRKQKSAPQALPIKLRFSILNPRLSIFDPLWVAPSHIVT